MGESTRRRVALITGVTGQDGAYLSEFLVRKGYEVHGVKRRASSFNTGRIDHLYQDPHESGRNFILHYGDLTDATNLIRIVQEVRPDEIYNLAAQSHVAVSFETPEYTANADAVGTLRLLEAIRILKLEGQTRFYQASTSEMYGKVQEIPQKETTPFYPRSPYGAAKVYAYWICVNYREAYGMYACNGILFNHECISADTPVLCRSDGLVDVKLPGELVALRRKGPSTQTFETHTLEVWDGSAWTQVEGITATRRCRTRADHQLLALESRGGVVTTTAHHQVLRRKRMLVVGAADVAAVESVPAREVSDLDHLVLAEQWPESPGIARISPELAEFMGLMVADGHIPDDPRRSVAQFTNNDGALQERVALLWRQLFLGSARRAVGTSGFGPQPVGHLDLGQAGREPIRWLRAQLYAGNGWKRVPALVLNAPVETQRAFLSGYYAGDGLKRGNGDSVKTNSPLLAQGLYWIYRNLGRTSSVYREQRGDRTYWQLNAGALAPGGKGQHLRKPADAVRRVSEATVGDDEWVFDFATASGVFAAGVGSVVVHNSPIRGETFVTRKITRAVARISLGLQETLHLGNLDSLRDWGHARDYVEAQWLILQQPEPDDFVIATGRQVSVRDFVNLAFAEVGVQLEWRGQGVDEQGVCSRTGRVLVKVDPRYFRPTEVETLLGDPSKARAKLGWEPRTSLATLVAEMIQGDLREAERDQLCDREGFRTYNYFE